GKPGATPGPVAPPRLSVEEAAGWRWQASVAPRPDEPTLWPGFQDSTRWAQVTVNAPWPSAACIRPRTPLAGRPAPLQRAARPSAQWCCRPVLTPGYSL